MSGNGGWLDVHLLGSLLNAFLLLDVGLIVEDVKRLVFVLFVLLQFIDLAYQILSLYSLGICSIK